MGLKMPIKTTGLEWNKFYSDPEFWPDDYWHEGEFVKVNGEEKDENYSISQVEDNDSLLISISGGVVYVGDNVNVDQIPLESHFKRWRKKQLKSIVLIDIDNSKLEELKFLISGLGGKVL